MRREGEEEVEGWWEGGGAGMGKEVEEELALCSMLTDKQCMKKMPPPQCHVFL